MSVKKVVVSMFAVAAFSSLAMAQGNRQSNQPNQPNQPPKEGFGRGGGRGMGGPGMGRMGGGPGRIDFSRLNLTDAQKQRVQALMDSNKKSFEASKTQFEEMGNLMRLKREGLLTTEQGTRLTALEAQRKTNMDKMQSDLMAILTPEQKTLVEQMKTERRGGGGMRDGMQQRGPGGGGMNGPGRPMGGGNQPPPPTNNQM